MLNGKEHVEKVAISSLKCRLNWYVKGSSRIVVFDYIRLKNGRYAPQSTPNSYRRKGSRPNSKAIFDWKNTNGR